MTRTLAVFGAGPALGLATARRFGAEGYRIALVARDRAKLDDLEKDLVERGIEAYGVTADLADTGAARAAAAAITGRFGTPDVLLYSPGDVSRLPVGALDLDAEELLTWLPLHLLTPIALIERSAAAGLWERGGFDTVVVGPLPRIDPDTLAQRYWELVRDRPGVEELVG